MSRYIDADALTEKVSEYYENTSKVKMFMILVKTTPSIDIVQCKECKWCMTCLNPYSENDDDYCSYGERKDQ